MTETLVPREWLGYSLLTRTMLMCAGSIVELRIQVIVKLYGVRIVSAVGEVISRAEERLRRERETRVVIEVYMVAMIVVEG